MNYRIQEPRTRRFPLRKVLRSAAACGMLFCSQAYAGDIECLSGTTGRSVTWNSAWQPDGKDQGVQYVVSKVTHVRSAESHSVQLELNVPAATVSEIISAPQRTFVVNSEALAEQVCKALAAPAIAQPAIVGEDSLLADATETMPHVAKPSDGEARFIRYTASGWVRDDPPPRQVLTECEVLNQRFACLPEEKARYGGALKSLEKELRSVRP